jgi:hypothetical protein
MPFYKILELNLNWTIHFVDVVSGIVEDKVNWDVFTPLWVWYGSRAVSASPLISIIASIYLIVMLTSTKPFSTFYVSCDCGSHLSRKSPAARDALLAPSLCMKDARTENERCSLETALPDEKADPSITRLANFHHRNNHRTISVLFGFIYSWIRGAVCGL